MPQPNPPGFTPGQRIMTIPALLAARRAAVPIFWLKAGTKAAPIYTLMKWSEFECSDLREVLTPLSEGRIFIAEVSNAETP